MEVQRSPPSPKARTAFVRRMLAPFADFVRQFFEQSSIHGFAYFVKAFLTWIEIFFWVVLVAICIFLCIVLAMQSIGRYEHKSTVVSIEKDHFYWNTTMPSMTICPLNRLDKKLFDDYCFANKIKGQQKEELFQFLESLANSTYTNFQNIKVFDSVDALNIKPEDYMHLIYSLTADYTLSKSDNQRVRTISDQDSIHTEQVLTEFGICYMTNNYLGDFLSAKFQILGEKPTDNKFEKMQDTVVHRVRSANIFDGDVTFSFIGFTGAIHIYIHSPFEVMKIDKVAGYAEESNEFELSSLEIIADDELEAGTRISQRKCRFRHESNLTHYRVYTKNICLQECRLNLAYKLCGCIPHFYPNLIETPKPVCSYRTLMTCFPKYTTTLMQLHDNSRDTTIHCPCLQNCAGSNIIVDVRNVMGESTDLLGSIGVLVIIKRYPIIRFKRQIIFTFADLLVSIGGTAGFFLGFSVLGAVEIVYFFTLRLFWYYVGYK